MPINLSGSTPPGLPTPPLRAAELLLCHGIPSLEHLENDQVRVANILEVIFSTLSREMSV